MIKPLEMHRERLGPVRGSFTRYCTSLAGMPGTVTLISGGPTEQGRYSLLGAYPYAAVYGRGRTLDVVRRGGTVTRVDNPFKVLNEIFPVHGLGKLPDDLPFAGGALGYLGYELAGHLERLPPPRGDRFQLPELCLFFPSLVVIRDRLKREDYLLTCKATPSGVSKKLRDLARQPEAPVQTGALLYSAGQLSANFSRSAYLGIVEQARRYIHQGDIYQVNLSQRFRYGFHGDPYFLFTRLLAENPAPYFAYINGGNFAVISTSPERFVKRRGQVVESRPIKGTRPRHADPEQDAAQRAELLASVKDSAELVMIVDLVRNDLSRVCQPGTVKVEEHRRIEGYRNVYHMVSVITGQLRSGLGSIELLRALFPAGSITGCPKIRAMEIINELEPDVRGVYTGAIGYIGWHDNVDLNVAIRTAVVKGDSLSFAVGGGIVYDSDPEAEYLETLHKGATFFKLLGVNP